MIIYFLIQHWRVILASRLWSYTMHNKFSNFLCFTSFFANHCHTGQCKRTGGCYNELVVAFYSTGGGVKGKQNLYLLTLLFMYELAFILFVMTPGAQTSGNIAVYGSAKQLVI